MVSKLVARYDRKLGRQTGNTETESEDHVVSDQAFFNQVGIKVTKA